MKILVFSDSHGRSEGLKKAIAMHPDAEYIIHAGDGKDDLKNVENRPEILVSVNGNSEDSFPWSKSNSDFALAEVGGKRIFVTHGHKYFVSFGLDRVIYTALENKADILIYGHTHIKYNRYVPNSAEDGEDAGGVYVFNPGSASRPRDCITPSYGIIDIRGDDILLSHGML